MAGYKHGVTHKAGGGERGGWNHAGTFGGRVT